MPAVKALAWQLLPSVRRQERERFLFFFALSGLLTLAQTVGFAGSEALFLVRVGTPSLPWIFVAASLVTVAGCIGYGGLVGRVRNDLLFVALLIAAAASIALAGIAVRANLNGVIHGLFCAAYLAQAVLINLHFWTFAADFFDTLQSKRLFPHLTVGASLGGMFGGALSALISHVGSAELLLFFWAGILAAAGLLVFVQRRNLGRWRSLDREEKDESSVQGMRDALRFLTRSPLARCLVGSVVGMITSLILIQYLYMDIFVRTFPSAEALATFIGIYLAVSNGVEILFGNRVTPWLLQRFGVAQTNLVHPITTLATFGLLAFDPRIFSAILARADRELLENTLASTVRQLSYNALPFRFRGRMRALLEGVVQFGAMAMAGALLLLLGDHLTVNWLCGLGFVTASLYLTASLFVRREYLRSLIVEMRRGRLDLDDLRLGIGQSNLAALARQWEQLMLEERDYPSPALLQLAVPLAESGFDAVLARATQHPHPRVRELCIEALARTGSGELPVLLLDALKDEQPSVRLAAARAAGRLGEPGVELAECLRERLEDPDWAVRAEAASVLGAEAMSTLRALVENDAPEATIEGLHRIPEVLSRLAHDRLGAPDARVRSAALRALTRFGHADSPTHEELLRALADPDGEVRTAAAEALGSRADPNATDALVRALDDDYRNVREAASHGLARLGEPGARAAAAHLMSARVWTMDAALRAIALATESEPMVHLQPAYAGFVERAWLLRSGLELFPQAPSLESRFLHAALENAYSRCMKMSFRVLSFLEDPKVVTSIDRSLESGTDRARADALEILSNLGSRHASGQLALLLEAGPFDDKLRASSAFFTPPDSIPALLDHPEVEGDRWLQLAARPYLEHPDLDRPRRNDPTLESAPPIVERATSPSPMEEHWMERLLALRSVPIFAQLTLDRLEAIHQLMAEAEYMEGEVIVREGDPGHELFVLLEGEVETYKHHGQPDQRLLSTLTPVGYFGEIAVLDNAPRSATNIASRDSRLLKLAGDPFKELVLKTPEISFEIFRVLTARIRAAETRQ